MTIKTDDAFQTVCALLESAFKHKTKTRFVLKYDFQRVTSENDLTSWYKKIYDTKIIV